MLTVSLPLYLLVIANAALIVAAAFAVLRVERALRDSEEFWKSPTGAAIRSDQKASPGNDVRLIARQLKALERSIERMQRAAPPGPPARVVELPMDHAVRMARRGATVTELTDQCGLNKGEAELLHRLHGKRKDTPPISRSA